MDEPTGSARPVPGRPSVGIERRLDLLEQRLERLEAAQPTTSTAMAPPPPPPPPVPPRVVASCGDGPWTANGTEHLLKWTGLGLVVTASVFLLNTAIGRGWVQPIHQLLAALAVGLALAWSAVSWRDNRAPWSVAAGIGSIVVLAVSAGAADRWLDLLALPWSLLGPAAVAASGLGLAHRIGRGSVAAIACGQALLVPLWLEAPLRYDPALTTTWVFVVLVTATVVAHGAGWSAVRTSTAALTGLLLPTVLAGVGPAAAVPWAVQAIITITAAVIAWPLLATRARDIEAHDIDRSGSTERILAPQMDHLAALSLVPAWWVTTVALWGERSPTPLSDAWAPETNYGVLALIMAAVAMATVAAARVGLRGAGIGRVASGADSPRPGAADAVADTSHTMTLGAVTLAIAGLALMAPGASMLVVAAMVAGAGLTAIGLAGQHHLVVAVGAGLSLGAGVATAIGLAEGIAGRLGFTEGVAYLVSPVIAAGAALIHRGPYRTQAGVVVAAAWAATMMWLWAVLGPVTQGQMLVSLAYAVMGIAAVIVGRRMVSGTPTPLGNGLPAQPSQVVRLGLATLAATVIKLVTVDLVAVDTLWRSLLFFVIGLGLLRIGLALQWPPSTRRAFRGSGADRSDGGGTIGPADSNQRR